MLVARQFQMVGAVQCKARSAKRALVVGLHSSRAAEEQRWWADSRGLTCDGWGKTAWMYMYCGLCMWQLPVCSQFIDEQEASEAVLGAVVQQKIVEAHGECHVLLCSGCTAVSGCCRPWLHATQRYSSPGVIVWGCRPPTTMCTVGHEAHQCRFYQWLDEGMFSHVKWDQQVHR